MNESRAQGERILRGDLINGEPQAQVRSMIRSLATPKFGATPTERLTLALAHGAT